MLMQISAAIIETFILHYISANIAHNCTNKVSRPMFLKVKDHYETIPELTTCAIAMLWKFSSACITENGTFRCISANIVSNLIGFFEGVNLVLAALQPLTSFKGIINRTSFTIYLNRQSPTHLLHTTPPPLISLQDDQCPGDQPESFV